MFAHWVKKLTARMLSSTAAVALGFGAAATLLAPGSAQATVISTAGGDTPQAAAQVGTLSFGDSISQFDVSLPEYWEFTWGGPTAAPDIASSGSFVGTDAYGDLELYSVTGGSPGALDTTLLDDTAFQITGTDGSFGSVAADLGSFSLTAGDDYVVGISSGDASFDIDLGTVPEPGALSLLGSALAALGFAGWRRKRRA
jgi:hypothetical protein